MSAHTRRLGVLLERLERQSPSLARDIRAEVGTLRDEVVRWRTSARESLTTLPDATTADGHLRNVGRYYTAPLLDVLTLLEAANRIAPLATSPVLARRAAEDLRRALKVFIPVFGSMATLRRVARSGPSNGRVR